jgi:hypothetical protein
MEQPGPDLLAPKVKIERRKISDDIDCSDSHVDRQHSISYEPIIDDPGPDPSDEGLQCRNGDHEFDRELQITISVC